MFRLGASLLVTLSLCAQTSWDRSRFLSDVQSFNDLLPNLLANELLEQKSVVYPNRLHIRMGQDALKPL